MFKVPDIFLEKLKCHLCDGYLNARPVVVKNGKQICAKCYRILPQDEKDQCVREISFEAMGSCLIFPCRYHKMGCDYTFTWNNENGHESECRKRYFTFPDVVGSDKKLAEECNTHDKDQSNGDKESDILSSYSAKYGKIASTSLITAEIKTGTTNLAFNHYDKHYDKVRNPVDLNVQRNVEFKNSRLPELLPYQEVNNNSVTSQGEYENIYSTIPSISNKLESIVKCLHCNGQVHKQNKNTCLFGHVSCNSCKEDMCVVCVKNLDGLSKIACRNASRGCKEILQQGDIGLHRDLCEFNEISCPVDKCEKKDVLEKIKEHLKENHADKTILSNEIAKNLGQKDQTLVFLCYEGIFKCFYYNYGQSVEIVVVYLGPCAKAPEYSFEVSIEVNKKITKRTLECANWNDCMIATGINFEKNELLNFGEKKLNCVFKLKIILAK